MYNLGIKDREDHVPSLGTAKNLRVTICTDNVSTTPPTKDTDFYVYKGTTALSSSVYITLPTSVPVGKTIVIRSLNGNLYVQSSRGLYSMSGTTVSTSAVSFGNTYARTFIYTSLGWFSAY